MAGKEGAREGADASTAAAAVESAASGDSGTGELSTKKVAVPAAAPKRTTSQEVSWFEAVPLGPRTAAAEVWSPPSSVYHSNTAWRLGCVCHGRLVEKYREVSLPKKRQSLKLSRVATCCLLPIVMNPGSRVTYKAHGCERWTAR